jgi:hypothetical protein
MESFQDDRKAPPYAILSHTWGENEVTFEDMQNGKASEKLEGYSKILNCAKQARKDGLNYIWVDTCKWNIDHKDPKVLIIMSLF